MHDNSLDNKRIAKNTLFLYFRTIIIMLVTLFTSRVILQSLGVVDYGIYNVVGGIVSMFSVLLGSMTDATQRFLTIELGKGEQGELNKVFSTSLLLHVIIGLTIIVIAEPFGLWFLYNKLIIPVDRLTAAFWVFQCSLVSFFVFVISIPYNALIVAHERMKAFAYISILDSALRLAIAFFVAVNSVIDRLVMYAVLMMLSQILLRNIYNLYCRKKFKESKFQYIKDLSLTKDFGRFAMLSMLGNLSFVCSNFGISLLLGTFFAPFVNAARGIAGQVRDAFSSFIKNFQTAINPQITKNYAVGNISEMCNLVFCGARLSFLLILIPIIPVLFETEMILKLWLKTVPEYTIPFVRLMVISSLISTLRNPLEVASKATGQIKMYEIYVHGSILLALPCSYVCLYLGASPVYVFAVTLLFEIISVVLSISETSKLTGLSIRRYYQNVVMKLAVTVVLSLVVPFCFATLMNQSILRIVLLSIFSMFSTFFSAFLVGLTTYERSIIIKIVRSRIIHLF